MTKSLTEKWKNEELPEDCYYILTKNGHIRKDRTCFYSHTDEQCFCFTSNKDIEEVLAPVPTYEEYTELLNKSKRLEIERNTFRDSYNFMCQRYADTELKLQMAIKALKNAYTYKPTTTLKKWCEEKIKEIEDVK